MANNNPAFEFEPFAIEATASGIMLKSDNGCWYGITDKEAIALRDWLNANVGDKVQHVKRGSTYNKIGEATLQHSPQMGIQATDLIDQQAMIVYVDHDGKMHVREKDQFNDGRFTNVK